LQSVNCLFHWIWLNNNLIRHHFGNLKIRFQFLISFILGYIYTTSYFPISFKKTIFTTSLLHQIVSGWYFIYFILDSLQQNHLTLLWVSDWPKVNRCITQKRTNMELMKTLYLVQTQPSGHLIYPYSILCHKMINHYLLGLSTLS
jgi:hypothetical protein